MYLITRQDVENILNTPNNIGDNNERLLINNVDYYQTAFVHKSYLIDYNQQILIPKKSYETLEFLGDALLGYIVTKYIVERFPEDDEGFLTKLRSRLVKDTML